jgi:hypothetical protein
MPEPAFKQFSVRLITSDSIVEFSWIERDVPGRYISSIPVHVLEKARTLISDGSASGTDGPWTIGIESDAVMFHSREWIRPSGCSGRKTMLSRELIERSFRLIDRGREDEYREVEYVDLSDSHPLSRGGVK